MYVIAVLYVVIACCCMEQSVLLMLYIQAYTFVHIHVYTLAQWKSTRSREQCRGFESHLRQLIFLWKKEFVLGVVLCCFVCCLV